MMPPDRRIFLSRRRRNGSNRVMTNPNDSFDDAVDRRLTDLEVKASFTEDTLEQLNQVVVRQQEQIDLLVRELKRLRDESRKGLDAGGPGDAAAGMDERPPHY